MYSREDSTPSRKRCAAAEGANSEPMLSSSSCWQDSRGQQRDGLECVSRGEVVRRGAGTLENGEGRAARSCGVGHENGQKVVHGATAGKPTRTRILSANYWQLQPQKTSICTRNPEQASSSSSPRCDTMEAWENWAAEARAPYDEDTTLKCAGLIASSIAGNSKKENARKWERLLLNGSENADRVESPRLQQHRAPMKRRDSNKIKPRAARRKVTFAPDENENRLELDDIDDGLSPISMSQSTAIPFSSPSRESSSSKSSTTASSSKKPPLNRWLTGGAALQTPARKDCAKTKGDAKHKTPATEPRTGSGHRKPRGKGKNKSFMPLTKFGRCAYAMMKLAWMKKSNGQAEPNATKKKKKLVLHESHGNGVSIPPPAMKFLQQITEAYVVDQIQTGRKIRERVKAGKTMAADLIGEGEAKNFVLDNSKEDGCAALLDVSSDSDDSSSDDAASDVEMELEKDKPENDAIDDEIFETKVRGKSFASMLNAAVVEHNIKHADLFDQLDFMGDEKATQSAPTDQSEK